MCNAMPKKMQAGYEKHWKSTGDEKNNAEGTTS